jgi:hypothetical protein
MTVDRSTTSSATAALIPSEEAVSVAVPEELTAT